MTANKRFSKDKKEAIKQQEKKSYIKIRQFRYSFLKWYWSSDQ